MPYRSKHQFSSNFCIFKLYYPTTSVTEFRRKPLMKLLSTPLWAHQTTQMKGISPSIRPTVSSSMSALTRRKQCFRYRFQQISHSEANTRPIRSPNRQSHLKGSMNMVRPTTVVLGSALVGHTTLSRTQSKLHVEWSPDSWSRSSIYRLMDVHPSRWGWQRFDSRSSRCSGTPEGDDEDKAKHRSVDDQEDTRKLTYARCPLSDDRHCFRGMNAGRVGHLFKGERNDFARNMDDTAEHLASISRVELKCLADPDQVEPTPSWRRE